MIARQLRVESPAFILFYFFLTIASLYFCLYSSRQSVSFCCNVLRCQRQNSLWKRRKLCCMLANSIFFKCRLFLLLLITQKQSSLSSCHHHITFICLQLHVLSQNKKQKVKNHYPDTPEELQYTSQRLERNGTEQDE